MRGVREALGFFGWLLREMLTVAVLLFWPWMFWGPNGWTAAYSIAGMVLLSGMLVWRD